MSHMLAILFEADPETDASSVWDIIRVEGTDKNARRRLRRAIVSKHGLIDRYGYSRVTYETWWAAGRIDTQDVTRRFLPVASEPKAKSGRRDRSNGQGMQNPSPPGDPQ
ncbi:hypothetical protein [Synechococcus phage Ssp-JY42]|nr:hypothetical protein [Synechococcus phage Yong-M4-211]